LLPLCASWALLLTACGGSEAAAEALQRNLETSSSVTASVIYEFQLDGSGVGVEGLATVTQRAPDRRVDSSIDGGTTDSLFLVSGQIYACEDGTCHEVSEQESQKVDDGRSIVDQLSLVDDLLGFREVLLEGISGSDEVTLLPNREIAGTKARCFQASGVGRAGEHEWVICFSHDDGVLLLLGGSYAGTSYSWRALDVNYSVDDRDFELPYPVS
jgi:hypothetical protein